MEQAPQHLAHLAFRVRQVGQGWAAHANGVQMGSNQRNVLVWAIYVQQNVCSAA
eukprot:SAG11_NODE_13946_length_632_cov_0.812383_2_plen_53_part_01